VHNSILRVARYRLYLLVVSRFILYFGIEVGNSICDQEIVICAVCRKLSGHISFRQEEQNNLPTDCNKRPQYNAMSLLHYGNSFCKTKSNIEAVIESFFSCRSLDYGAPLSSNELPVPQIRIEQMDDQRIQTSSVPIYPNTQM
jgi:hypothetical protein